MRYRLRTLLILLAVLPPLLALAWPPLSRAVHAWLHPETESEIRARLLDAIEDDIDWGKAGPGSKDVPTYVAPR